MNDHHALITQLCAELDHNRRMLLDDRRVTHPLADRARAALAADGPAVPEGREPASVVSEPSDEELLEKGPSLEEVEELCEEHCFNVEGYESLECLQGLINDALARWGTPNQAEIRSSLGAAPAPPDEGEVGELVAKLRRLSPLNPLGTADPTITRAAALLERLSAAVRAVVPVPVSERLPGDQLCWWYEPDEDDDGSGYGGRWTLLRIRGGAATYTHWLPATALPTSEATND